MGPIIEQLLIVKTSRPSNIVCSVVACYAGNIVISSSTVMHHNYNT